MEVGVFGFGRGANFFGRPFLNVGGTAVDGEEELAGVGAGGGTGEAVVVSPGVLGGGSGTRVRSAWPSDTI